MPSESKVLQSLVRKIHPQLPLSRRESQQLLQLLQTSFRDNLDRAHGPSQEAQKLKSATAVAATSTATNASNRRRAPGSSLAHAHVDSILTHPLFAVSPHIHDPSTVARTKQSPEAIIRRFNRSVASGAADVHAAVTSLRQLSKFPNPVGSPPDEFAPSIIVQWLLKTFPFPQQLHDATTQQAAELDSLVPQLMIRDGRRDLLLAYVENIVSCARLTSHASPVWQRARSILECSIITHLHWHASPENALRFYIDVSHWWRDTGLPPRSAARHAYLKSAIPLAKYLSKHQEVLQPLQEPYDDFSNLVQLLGAQILHARLQVVHPTRPSLSSAMTIFRNDMDAHATLTNPTSSSSRRRQLVSLYLLVSQHLMEQEQYDDAGRILQFLRDAYGDELQLSQHVGEPTKDHQQASGSAVLGDDTLNILDKLALD